MNTVTENQQPQLLWVDEKGLKKEELGLMRAEGGLNRFIMECEKQLKTQERTSPELKEDLKTRKMAALMDELRKDFSFPNAPDEFNLQSMGVNLETAKAMTDRSLESSRWGQYQFELDDMGLFVPVDPQPIFEQYYYYANTQRKIAALELANSLVELVDRAHENRLIHGELCQNLCMAFNHIVKVEGDPRQSSARIEVDKERIAKEVR